MYEESEDGLRILNESVKLKTCLTMSEINVCKNRCCKYTLHSVFLKTFFRSKTPIQKMSSEESHIYKTGFTK